MKKTYSAVITALLLSLALACGAWAGNGNGAGDCTGPVNGGTQRSDNNSGANGNGAANGTGPIHEIVEGGEFSIEGGVEFIGEPGDGMTLDDGTVVYGLAPYWYWDSEGVDKPAIGDVVYVEGYTVIIDGVERYVAVSITIDSNGDGIIDESDDTVLLRDENLRPLWRSFRIGTR